MGMTASMTPAGGEGGIWNTRRGIVCAARREDHRRDTDPPNFVCVAPDLQAHELAQVPQIKVVHGLEPSALNFYGDLRSVEKRCPVHLAERGAARGVESKEEKREEMGAPSSCSRSATAGADRRRA